ncbi:MAG: hypothetical protein HZB71_10090 [Betaproteobacteria bacterium]|nr:hypothetical protein [Betaproteobacteria bacterium]
MTKEVKKSTRIWALARMDNIAKLHIAEKMLLATSLLISVSILLGALIEAARRSHDIFTAQALLLFFLASAVCTALAASRRLSAQLAALFVNLYFLHRIPILYFSPELMDYPFYLGNSQEIIEAAAFYFFLCISFLGLGISFVSMFQDYHASNHQAPRPAPITEPVRLFFLKADWRTLVRVSVPVGAVLLVIQAFALAYLGLGITGAVRESAELNSLLAITEMAKFLSPVAVFGYLVGLEQGDAILRKKSKILLGIILASYILVASRSTFFGLAISFYVGIRFLGLKSQGKYAKSLFALMALSALTYPLITYSRYLFLDLDVPFHEWFGNFHFLREVSGRLGTAVESYFLWFKYITEGPHERLPTLAIQIYDVVNALVPGEIIQYEPLVNYAKLQSYIGRPDQAFYQSVVFLEELGGSGENPGSYGMAFMLFGNLSFMGFLFAGMLCSSIESSRISSFWKFYWTPFILTTPWLVPSTAFVHQTIIISGLIFYSSWKRSRSARASANSIRRAIQAPSALRASR